MKPPKLAFSGITLPFKLLKSDSKESVGIVNLMDCDESSNAD